MNYKLALKYVNLFFFIDRWVKQVVALKKLNISLSLHLDTLAKCNWHLIVALKTLTWNLELCILMKKKTTEDAKMEFATSKYQLHQIINESIHVIEIPLFCTDLIFTSQQNLVVDSSVHPSLHPNYHHQT